MEAMETQSFVFLGIKVKPGPIERYKVENFNLDNTVDTLKIEAEKKTNVPSGSLELIHHGKILKDHVTLQDSGIKNGEMVHVVKKKEPPPRPTTPTFSDDELQQLNSSLRSLGCTPNAPGWTRAMQLLNDESAMEEILEHAPSLNDNCVALSILHEVELLAALGSNLDTMRRGAEATPQLLIALRHLMRLVRSRSASISNDNAPTSGFAYSLEALSEEEDADEEEGEGGDAGEGGEGTGLHRPITQEQLAAALQAATEAVFSGGRQDGLLRLLQAAPSTPPTPGTPGTPAAPSPATPGILPQRTLITPAMFREAFTDAISRTRPTSNAGTPMELSATASSSSSTVVGGGGGGAAIGGVSAEVLEEYRVQLHHMHELGLVDDPLNVRALIICSGDVNAAINLVFSGVIGEDTI